MSEASEFVFRYKQPTRRSLFPTFFVGLGGAGGAVVDRILQKLSRCWDFHKYDGLFHGFVLDTDQNALGGLQYVPEAHRILISDFDKRWYVGGKRGKSYLPADPWMLQWVHDWYRIRSEVAARPRQIRVESRLCLQYQLEQDRGGIVRCCEAAIRRALAHDSPFRATTPAEMRVVIFGSVAGGTGSGSFLSMAYLWQELIRQRGFTPKVYAHLLLPGPFLSEVPLAQQQDVDANGYAALKELEHLMKLGLEGDSLDEAAQFHFSAYHRGQTHVHRAPFNFVYLLDEPASLATRDLGEFVDSVADSAFVHFFSPVFGNTNSRWDNSIKRAQSGTDGGDVLNYGTYGCNALILPDRDILEDCAHRWTLQVVDEDLAPASDAGATAGPAAELDELTPQERNLRLDEAFVRFVDRKAAEEAEAKKKGRVFTAIKAQLSSVTERPLTKEHATLLADRVARLTGQVVVPDAGMIVEGDINLDREKERTRLAVQRSRENAGRELERLREEIEEGRFFGELFTVHGVNPLAQRLFLIGLVRDLRERVRELDRTRPEEARLDFDSDYVRRELEAHTDQLVRTAHSTIWERIKRENRDFNDSKRAFGEWYSKHLVQGWSSLLRNKLETELLALLLRQAETLLETHRQLATRAARLRRELATLCGSILRMGGLSLRDSESNLFAFDLEVLRDEALGVRLWDLYYERVLQPDRSFFPAERIVEVLTAALGATPGETGAGESGEQRIGLIRDRLLALGRELLSSKIVGSDELSKSRSKLGLLLDEALDLEARWVLSQETPTVEPEPEDIRRYKLGKLGHAVAKSGLLCHLAPPASDDQVINDTFVMACLHPVYGGDGGLAGLLDTHDARVPCIVNSNWDDAKVVLIYRAALGVPLFCIRAVNARMQGAYQGIQSRFAMRRKYPLHIDKNWEETLPGLDPLARKAEGQARLREEEHVCFAFARLAEAVTYDGKKRQWSLELSDPPVSRRLGKTPKEAFEAFCGLAAGEAALLRERSRELRRLLEGPDEPATAWQEFVRYYRQAALDAGKKTASEIAGPHRQALAGYLRAHAPADLVASLGDLLPGEEA